MRAASRVSPGTPLTAADSSTIEKPTCAQISITISRKLLKWNSLCCSQATGSTPRRRDDGVQQADLRLARGAAS